MEFLQQYITSILICIFLGFTFLQSGVDKVTDWKGNVDFITGHFKSSPLQGYVPLLLAVILVMEILAGALMFIGTFHLAMTGTKDYASYGLILGALTLIFLLIGQRLAKDYQGATSLTVYFIVTILGLHIIH